jgi:hypothetical protein
MEEFLGWGGGGVRGGARWGEEERGRGRRARTRKTAAATRASRRPRGAPAAGSAGTLRRPAFSRSSPHLFCPLPSPSFPPYHPR